MHVYYRPLRGDRLKFRMCLNCEEIQEFVHKINIHSIVIRGTFRVNGLREAKSQSEKCREL